MVELAVSGEILPRPPSPVPALKRAGAPTQRKGIALVQCIMKVELGERTCPCYLPSHASGGLCRIPGHRGQLVGLLHSLRE